MDFKYNPELLAEIRESGAEDYLSTAKDFIRWGFSLFSASDIYYGHGFDNPWDESRILVLNSLRLPIDSPDELLSSNLTIIEKVRIIKLIQERLGNRKPLAYLTNHAHFAGLEFYVNESVIVPRSPIAEIIANGFSGLLYSEPTKILDMCTGSGCIAIALAHHFEHAEVDAVDLSIDALNVAQINIENHELDERVFPINSDLFTNLSSEHKYDLIVSNPPYVDLEDLETMPAEYHHEPQMALGSGEDGLIITKRILATAANFLNDNGVLICEVGNSMIHLEEQFPQVPFNWIELENGGLGVFSLTKAQLLEHQSTFSKAAFQDE